MFYIRNNSYLIAKTYRYRKITHSGNNCYSNRLSVYTKYVFLLAILVFLSTMPDSLYTTHGSLCMTSISLSTTHGSLYTIHGSLYTTPNPLHTTPNSLHTTPNSLYTTPGSPYKWCPQPCGLRAPIPQNNALRGRLFCIPISDDLGSYII